MNLVNTVKLSGLLCVHRIDCVLLRLVYAGGLSTTCLLTCTSALFSQFRKAKKYKKLEDSDNAEELSDHGEIEMDTLSSGSMSGGDSSESLTQGGQAGHHSNRVAGGATLESAIIDSGVGSCEDCSDRSASLEETSFSVVEPSLAQDEGSSEGGQCSKGGKTSRQVQGWLKWQDSKSGTVQSTASTTLLDTCYFLSCTYVVFIFHCSIRSRAGTVVLRAEH